MCYNSVHSILSHFLCSLCSCFVNISVLSVCFLLDFFPITLTSISLLYLVQLCDLRFLPISLFCSHLWVPYSRSAYFLCFSLCLYVMSPFLPPLVTHVLSLLFISVVSIIVILSVIFITSLFSLTIISILYSLSLIYVCTASLLSLSCTSVFSVCSLVLTLTVTSVNSLLALVYHLDVSLLSLLLLSIYSLSVL